MGRWNHSAWSISAENVATGADPLIANAVSSMVVPDT